MNAPSPVRPARARAETLSQKKKQARVAAAVARVALDRAVAAALSRGRGSFVDRLTAALATDVFDGELHAWRPLAWMIRRLPAAKQPAVTAFVAAVEARAPGLCLVPTGRRTVLGAAVINMAAIEHRLLRPVTSWTPRARGLHRRWNELVAWTCCAYPQPPFLDAAFLQPNLDDDVRAVAPFVGLGGSWRDAGLPTTITRATAHALSTTRARHPSLTNIVRACQAASVGVSRPHMAALGKAAGWRWCFEAAREELWLELFSWLARHPGVAADDVAAIVDNVADVDLPFRLAGRTATSLPAWARERARQEELRTKGRLDVGPLPRCTVDGGDYVLTREQADPTAQARLFHVEQILDGQALVDEGIAMKHCVGTYADAAKKGETAIFSLRVARFGESLRRALTIEVDVSARRVEQVRGKTNREPSEDELAILHCWAQERQLTVSKDAV